MCWLICARKKKLAEKFCPSRLRIGNELETVSMPCPSKPCASWLLRCEICRMFQKKNMPAKQKKIWFGLAPWAWLIRRVWMSARLLPNALKVASRWLWSQGTMKSRPEQLPEKLACSVQVPAKWLTAKRLTLCQMKNWLPKSKAKNWRLPASHLSKNCASPPRSKKMAMWLPWRVME